MRHLLVILALTLLLPACRKHSGSMGGGATDSSVTVYAAGYVYGGLYNQACYWKNGQITLLPPTPNSDDNSFAYGIWVQGTDVYVVGASPLGATLWVNGKPQIIGNSGSQAGSVTVSGKNVYIAGSQLNTADGPNNFAALWTNGQQTILPTNFVNVGASQVLVNGSDIYVLGGVDNGIGNFGAYAAYWKNDNFFQLTTDSVCSSAGGITVDGSDVYIGGTLTRGATTAVYWKNGTLIPLPSDSSNPGAGAIAVIGNDVYVAGGVYNPTRTIFNAVYWKNGQQYFLADPSVQSTATCIATNGSDVYIGGMQATPIGNGPHYNEFEATYWKNGVPTTLPWPGGAPGYRYVFGIFVTGGSSTAE